MTNRQKIYFFLATIPTFIALCIIIIGVVFFDFIQLFSSPKQFVSSHFPTIYVDLKRIALNSGTENFEKGEQLSIPLIGLKLSRNDTAHFLNLYDKYRDPRFGVEYYAEHNVWRKARLTFEGKKHPIKTKSHGRSPDEHQEGDFISFR